MVVVVVVHKELPELKIACASAEGGSDCVVVSASRTDQEPSPP